MSWMKACHDYAASEFKPELGQTVDSYANALYVAVQECYRSACGSPYGCYDELVESTKEGWRRFARKNAKCFDIELKEAA